MDEGRTEKGQLHPDVGFYADDGMMYFTVALQVFPGLVFAD